MPQSILEWTVFSVLVLGALLLDLFVFQRKAHEIGLREALTGSAVWVGLALLFNVGVWLYAGPQAAIEFTTGYLIELSLSVDNLFVFLLIFSYFAVPKQYQHGVLFWGIIGAIVMRLAFILAGVALLERFHWIIYVFGAILVVSGLRLAFGAEREVHPERNPVLSLARRIFPVTSEYEGGRFFVLKEGRRWVTPLFLVLVMVETTDLIFAVDSIPAVLAITRDPFIVFSSNIFAILGLRALYFSLAGVMGLFHYLHFGLALILVFVGLKMIVSKWMHIPTPLALGVVVGVIATCVIASLVNPKKVELPHPPGPDELEREG